MTGRHASVLEVMGEKKRGKKISFFAAAGGECEEDGKIKEERKNVRHVLPRPSSAPHLPKGINFFLKADSRKRGKCGERNVVGRISSLCCRWNDKTRVDSPPPLKVPRDMTERAWEESERKNQGGQMIRQAISNWAKFAAALCCWVMADRKNLLSGGGSKNQLRSPQTHKHELWKLPQPPPTPPTKWQ